MANSIPLALINFEAYAEGERLLGLVSCDLVDIENETTDIAGAGISGTLSFPIKGNFSNFTSTLHFRTLTTAGCKILSQNRGHHLSLRGAKEVFDAGSGERKVVPVRVDMRCHGTKLTAGKLEAGATMDTELEVMLDALKITIDGKTALEIDKFNYVYSVDGEDMLADVSAALGL